MYFSDPVTPSALAATGVTAAYGLTSVAVLIFAGVALLTIAKQVRKNRGRRDR